MSRGGRGGRGGQGGGGSSRLNHGTVPFEIDAALEEKASGMRKDHGLFPPLIVPRPTQPDRRLRQQIEDYRDLQLKFRNGPFYRLGSDVGSRGGVSKERRNKSAFNAFQDNPSYLKERAARAREFMEAEFDKLPWCKEMFPEELWETIGAGKGAKYRPKIGRVNSRLAVSTRLDKMDEHADDEQEQKEPVEREEKDNDSTKNDDEDDGQPGRKRDDDQNSVEYDDTFEDGEEDMAGDYNAEQYFDGGDDDNDDGLDGGGED